MGRGIEASALRGTCVPFNNMHLPGQIGVQLQLDERAIYKAGNDCYGRHRRVPVVAPAKGKGEGPLGRVASVRPATGLVTTEITTKMRGYRVQPVRR